MRTAERFGNASNTEVTTKPALESAETASDGGAVIKEAVGAALDGNFRAWSKEHGFYEGELADRINNIFLEVIGDIILENFELIEDYREDVEEWMK